MARKDETPPPRKPAPQKPPAPVFADWAAI
jgi:hypothetical protein